MLKPSMSTKSSVVTSIADAFEIERGGTAEVDVARELEDAIEAAQGCAGEVEIVDIVMIADPSDSELVVACAEVNDDIRAVEVGTVDHNAVITGTGHNAFDRGRATHVDVQVAGHRAGIKVHQAFEMRIAAQVEVAITVDREGLNVFQRRPRNTGSCFLRRSGRSR